MITYITEVFKKFVPISGTSVPVGNNIEEVVKTLLDNPSFICICEEGKGVLIGAVYPAYWNPEILVAQELGFWVEPDYRNTGLGKDLLKSFEEKAKALGAVEITMIALESSSPHLIGKFYERLGYHKLEHSYIKRI